MRNYGFDYLVEKVHLLTEMPRPTTIFNPISVDFNSLYEKLINDEINRGNNSIGTRQLIVWRFIMSTLNDFLVKRGKGYTKTEEGDGKVPLTSKELSKKFGGGTSHGQTKVAVLTMVKAHKDVVNDPKVREFLNDPENMEKFKEYAGFGKTSDDIEDETREDKLGKKSISSRRKGKIKSLKDTTGMGIVETEELNAKLHDKIIQMNRVMAGRKGKATRKGETYSPKTDNDNWEIDNQAIADAMEIVYFIDSAINEDKVTGGNFSKTALDDLQYLRNMYQATIDGGQGATIDEFIAFVNKLKRMKGMTEDRIEALDAVLYEIEDLESYSRKEPTLSDIYNAKTEIKIEGYDNDVINKYLDTPELKRSFKTLMDSRKRWRAVKNAELQKRVEKKMEDVGYKKFLAKRPDMEGQDETFVNPAIIQLIDQLKKLQKKLDTTEDESEIAKLEKKFENIQKKISQIRKGLNSEEGEESGVMGYLSEQISKDRHINLIGEFKERGYKKFKNYHHWLSTNQEI